METRAAKRLRESQQNADGPHMSGGTDHASNDKLSDSRDSLVERKVRKKRRRAAPRLPTFDDLPDETLIKIFSNLEFEDLCSMRLVGKRWNRILSSGRLLENITFRVHEYKRLEDEEARNRLERGLKPVMPHVREITLCGPVKEMVSPANTSDKRTRQQVAIIESITDVLRKTKPFFLRKITLENLLIDPDALAFSWRISRSSKLHLKNVKMDVDQWLLLPSFYPSPNCEEPMHTQNFTLYIKDMLLTNCPAPAEWMKKIFLRSGRMMPLVVQLLEKTSTLPSEEDLKKIQSAIETVDDEEMRKFIQKLLERYDPDNPYLYGDGMPAMKKVQLTALSPVVLRLLEWWSNWPLNDASRNGYSA